MTNKEKARIKWGDLQVNISINGYNAELVIEEVYQIIEIASQPDWFLTETHGYPEKGEMAWCKVQIGSISPKIEYRIGLMGTHRFNIEMDWVYVIAWTPLPKYEQK